MDPTDEQHAAVEAFSAGHDLVLQAGAGAGKTSTLRMLAAATERTGVYLAYNRAIADDAKARFPRTVQCATAHSLAMRAVGHRYRDRLNAPRQPARVAARLLRLREPLHLGQDIAPLAPEQLARLVAGTVQRFCWSADDEPTEHHVPTVRGLEDQPEARAELAGVLVAGAHRAWADLTRTDGALRFEHDHYLKMWQLSRPRLPVDFVMLDEAQDANPVIADVVTAQQHTQRALVGDTSQAIYGWRGAVDAMRRFPTGRRLTLSQSFRFGPAIAAEANKWLGLLDAPLRITGHHPIPSRLGKLDRRASAVLCRSNAEAVAELLAAHAANVPAALVGGGREVRRLAEAALELKDGRGTSHPELCAFTSWAQVQEYVDLDDGGRDLKTFVALIDSYGPDTVIGAVDRSVDEQHATVTVSTAHKAKGREWDTVRIADDFQEPREDEVPRAEAMLAYVAVTRARRVLDRGGLDWVDEWTAPEPPADTNTDGGSRPATHRARHSAPARPEPVHPVDGAPTDPPTVQLRVMDTR